MEEIETTLKYHTQLLESIVSMLDSNSHQAAKNKKLVDGYMEIAESIFKNINSPAVKPFKAIMEQLKNEH